MIPRALFTSTLMLLATVLPAVAADLNMPPGPGGLDTNFSTAVLRVGGDHYFYGSTQTEKILFNVKRDTNGDGLPDSWKYAQSKLAIDMGGGVHGNDPNSTVAMGTVLSMWNAGIQVCYNHPATPWICYKALMYFVFQGNGNINAGQVCLSFSNDLETWTRPISAQRGWNGSWHDCDDNNGEVVAEAVSAFHPYGDANLAVIHQEGDFGIVTAAVGTTDTTSWLSTGMSSHSPHVIHYSAKVTSSGMPVATYTAGTEHYRFLVNLDAAILPDNKTVLVSRVYPWPFDVDGGIPSLNGQPCPEGLATLPNRTQLLWMNTGSSLYNIASGSWNLDIDFGSTTGWYVWNGSSHVRAPLAGFMSAGTLDMESVNFVKDGLGRVWDRDPGSGLRYQLVHSGQPDKTQECAAAGGLLPTELNTMRVDDLISTASSPGGGPP